MFRVIASVLISVDLFSLALFLGDLNCQLSDFIQNLLWKF
jgi:hypothetical protein